MRWCPECGGSRFEGRRWEIRTVVVDGDGVSLPGDGGVAGWEPETLTVGVHWGPYVCLGCGRKTAELEDLPETGDVLAEGEAGGRRGPVRRPRRPPDVA